MGGHRLCGQAGQGSRWLDRVACSACWALPASIAARIAAATATGTLTGALWRKNAGREGALSLTRCACSECDLAKACVACQHNTEGQRCERCKAGFFGNATAGTPLDCVPCRIACNLHTEQCASSLAAAEGGGTRGRPAGVLLQRGRLSHPREAQGTRLRLVSCCRCALGCLSGVQELQRRKPFHWTLLQQLFDRCGRACGPCGGEWGTQRGVGKLGAHADCFGVGWWSACRLFQNSGRGDWVYQLQPVPLQRQRVSVRSRHRQSVHVPAGELHRHVEPHATVRGLPGGLLCRRGFSEGL